MSTHTHWSKLAPAREEKLRREAGKGSGTTCMQQHHVVRSIRSHSSYMDQHFFFFSLISHCICLNLTPAVFFSFMLCFFFFHARGHCSFPSFDVLASCRSIVLYLTLCPSVLPRPLLFAFISAFVFGARHAGRRRGRAPASSYITSTPDLPFC